MIKLFLILSILLISWFYTTLIPRKARSQRRNAKNGGDKIPPLTLKTYTYVGQRTKSHIREQPRDKPHIPRMSYKEWCLLNKEIDRVRAQLFT